MGLGKSVTVWVTGTGRSGTSAVAGVLVRLGINMGSTLLAGDAGNPRGYYEDQELGRIHERVARTRGDVRNQPELCSDLCRSISHRLVNYSQWGVKDPRLADVGTRVLNFYFPMSTGFKVVFCRRGGEAARDSYRMTYSAGFLESWSWYITRSMGVWRLKRCLKRRGIPFTDVWFGDLTSSEVWQSEVFYLSHFLIGRGPTPQEWESIEEFLILEED